MSFVVGIEVAAWKFEEGRIVDNVDTLLVDNGMHIPGNVHIEASYMNSQVFNSDRMMMGVSIYCCGCCWSAGSIGMSEKADSTLD